MLRVRVCAAHMGGFLGPKQGFWVRNKGLFSADLPKTLAGFLEIGKKLSNSAKIHHKCGYNGNGR